MTYEDIDNRFELTARRKKNDLRYIETDTRLSAIHLRLERIEQLLILLTGDKLKELDKSFQELAEIKNEIKELLTKSKV
jgi:hypothetical protein